MDGSFDDPLENIVTVRPKLKKQGNSYKIPSSTKNEMEERAEREDVVIEKAEQKPEDNEKNDTTETEKIFSMVADMIENIKMSINQKIESSERRVMKKVEESSR